jgi:hypothetical protein
MFSKTAKRNALLSLMAAGALIVMANVSVQAAMAPLLPGGAWSDIQSVSGGCGHGFRRNLAGHCVRDVVYHQQCPAGMRAARAPTRSGYRCTHM